MLEFLSLGFVSAQDMMLGMFVRMVDHHISFRNVCAYKLMESGRKILRRSIPGDAAENHRVALRKLDQPWTRELP